METIKAWDPEKYETFDHLRRPALTELLLLIKPELNMRLLDVGAGSGDFSCELWERLRPQSLLGIEPSDKMLAQAQKRSQPGLQFRAGNINNLNCDAKFDLIFSNGVLQYAQDALETLTQFRALLSDRGQIAIQLPHTYNTPPIAMGFELAQSHKYSPYFPEHIMRPRLLRTDEYATHLYKVGFEQPLVKVQAHTHPMQRGYELFMWLDQTFLQRFAAHMPEGIFQQFRDDYAHLLNQIAPFDQPHLYVLPRLYLWGQLS